MSLANSPALRYSAELRNSGLPARKLGLVPPCAAFLQALEAGLRAPGATPLLCLGCSWGAADCTYTDEYPSIHKQAILANIAFPKSFVLFMKLSLRLLLLHLT